MNTNSESPQNDAVDRCNRAWLRAFKKELANIDEGDSEYPATKAGNAAYLRAMPPLSGNQNICDFIACIAHALIIQAVAPMDAERLIAVAKMAVVALGRQPTATKPPVQKYSKGGQALLKAAAALSNRAEYVAVEA
jgi:hypothetical protein